MNCKILGMTIAGLMVAATPALAHHSVAMFDRAKSVTLVGTVKEFQWTNPHSWAQVVITDPATGAMQEWSVEMTNPSGLIRQGWKKTSLKPGDKVTFVVNPLRGGSNGGLFVSAILADGTHMGRSASGA